MTGPGFQNKSEMRQHLIKEELYFNVFLNRFLILVLFKLLAWWKQWYTETLKETNKRSKKLKKQDFWESLVTKYHKMVQGFIILRRKPLMLIDKEFMHGAKLFFV